MAPPIPVTPSEINIRKLGRKQVLGRCGKKEQKPQHEKKGKQKLIQSKRGTNNISCVISGKNSDLQEISNSGQGAKATVAH